MDFKEKKTVPNPREGASVISRLLFLWIVPLFRKGLKKDLAVDDLYDCPREDVAEKLGNALSNEWDRERKKAKESLRNPKFFHALNRVFGLEYFFLGAGVLLDECLIRVAQPIFLRLLIRSFGDQSITSNQQYLYASGVCLTTLLHALLIHPISFAILHIGMKSRVSASSLIYRKTLCLSKASQEKTTVGQLVTLISSDVQRFDMNLMFVPYLVIGPIQTVIFVYFLWEELGVSCLAGVGIVFLLMPLQYYIGILTSALRFRIAKKSEERGKYLSEVITAMRVIKMYAWELPFSTLINKARKEEVKILRTRAYLKSFYLSMFLASKKFIPYTTFLAYVLIGHNLTADKVFFAVTIFDIIITNMVSILPSAAAGVGELAVAIQRIEDFLLLEEKHSDSRLKIIPISYDKESDNPVPFVRMSSLSATWTGCETFHLENLSVDLTGDKLVIVCGPVGSGKSSFLQALLGEMRISRGQCNISGSLSYIAQDPWIFASSLRQNILFGKDFDEDLYDEVVSQCALTTDFHQFPQGDQTLVGERGVTLSGGQKARLNMARAMYRGGDIVLYDDPLSALDSRVGRYVFEKCVKQMHGKLRILATHQLQYLPKADHVIVMSKGQILAQGTYEELVEGGIDFVKLISAEVETDWYRKASLTKLEAIEQELKKEEEDLDLHEEKMAAGSVSSKTYWEYFSSGGSLFEMTLVFFGFLISQMLYTASDYWLSYWTNEEESWSLSTKTYGPAVYRLNASMSMSPSPFSSSEPYSLSLRNSTFLSLPSWTTKLEEDISSYLGQYFYISVYSGLVLLVAFATTINSAYFFRYCMRISIRIHNKMFGGVVRARMRFFDNNNSGRIMNRFSKDLCAIDESLPSACYDVITIFLIMIGVIIVVIVSNIYVIVPSTCLVIALWLIRRFYIQTARDVKRIEAVSRSPLFTQLTTSIQGLVQLRALNSQKVLTKQFDQHQDIHSASWFLFISSNRWFGIWLEMISIVFLTIVTFSFMFMTTKSGFVGLAISSVLSVTFKFQWGMRQSAELENLFTSVERCLEYTQIDPEPPLDSLPKDKPPSDWPQNGAITFKDVSLNYDDNKEVLHKVSFSVEGKEKIGVVGRTGAGKSSMIQVLFRMTEPSGQILIDGVDIQEIGLHDLRTKISIIPQDPVLFGQSVRYNLDPFAQFEDMDLWTALDEVHLKDSIPTLDFILTDGGGNFSVGQRQLVCLARAILRKNKIIVMDEVTANVDPRTDSLIQQTIRTKFSECTIITIAHRLLSVMDCDKILVLENGKLMEYDHPHNLLENKDSILYNMAQHTGKSNLASLKKIAETAFNNRKRFSVISTNEMQQLD